MFRQVVLSFMVIGLFSCDQCKDVECFNDGICDDGICKCLPHSEGQYCELHILDEREGTYIGTWDCMFEDEEPGTVRLEEHPDGNKLTVVHEEDNFSYYMTFDAGSNEEFTVPSQQVGSKYVAGQGSFEYDRLSLVIDVIGGGSDCKFQSN